MTGFGLYPLANEGAPIHPDVSVARPELLIDDEYQKMLSAYRDYYLLHYRVHPYPVGNKNEKAFRLSLRVLQDRSLPRSRFNDRLTAQSPRA